MKSKTLIGTVLAFTFGFSGFSYATSDSYFPPERINCKLNEASRVLCQEFNRNYLIEDVTTAELRSEKHKIFFFHSAVAYLAPRQSEATIYFTYRNNLSETLRLKTIHQSIRPDLVNGDWKKTTEDIYVCTAGYMNCPITNLP